MIPVALLLNSVGEVFRVAAIVCFQLAALAEYYNLTLSVEFFCIIVVLIYARKPSWAALVITFSLILAFERGSGYLTLRWLSDFNRSLDGWEDFASLQGGGVLG